MVWDKTPCASCGKGWSDHAASWSFGEPFGCEKFARPTNQKGGESVKLCEMHGAANSYGDYSCPYCTISKLKSEHEKMVEKIRGLENMWRNYLGNFAEQLRMEFPEIFPTKEETVKLSITEDLVYPFACALRQDMRGVHFTWADARGDIHMKKISLNKDGKITVEQ